MSIDFLSGNACKNNSVTLFFSFLFYSGSTGSSFFSCAPAQWASLGCLPSADLGVIWKRVTISLEKNYFASVELHHAPLARPDTNALYSLRHNTGHSALVAKDSHHIHPQKAISARCSLPCARVDARFRLLMVSFRSKRLFVAGRQLVDEPFSGNRQTASLSL